MLFFEQTCIDSSGQRSTSCKKPWSSVQGSSNPGFNSAENLSSRKRGNLSSKNHELIRNRKPRYPKCNHVKTRKQTVRTLLFMCRLSSPSLLSNWSIERTQARERIAWQEETPGQTKMRVDES